MTFRRTPLRGSWFLGMGRAQLVGARVAASQHLASSPGAAYDAFGPL
ncbi:hypothetical protein [Sphingopyxis macrogoltabida]|nr:hypothetical protein [Sphingopyxis macrogoltabida]